MKNVCAYLGAIAVGLVLVGGSTAPVAAQAKAAPAKAGVRVVKIVADDTMKFDVTMIEAKPGEVFEVQLTSKGTLPKEAMGHNFVLLLKKTTDPNAFAMDAAMAKATAYIPEKYKADVIATAIAGPGETVKVTVTAPKVAGSYTYLCSFAGHFMTGMKGTLLVK